METTHATMQIYYLKSVKSGSRNLQLGIPQESIQAGEGLRPFPSATALDLKKGLRRISPAASTLQDVSWHAHVHSSCTVSDIHAPALCGDKSSSKMFVISRTLMQSTTKCFHNTCRAFQNTLTIVCKLFENILEISAG